MIKRSDKVTVLVDSTKFNKTFFQNVYELDAIDVVITEKEISENMKILLDKHDIKVLIVQ